MASPQFDVVIVGAGAAGLTAAIGLARSGFQVAVVEAAAFPGAENWSGCVYFTENLAHPDILGPDGVAALAWERRLVERGFFATDGHGLLGMKYRDPDAFRHCYTVLRPIYDHHLAQAALRHGVALLTSTTAESLIREGAADSEESRIIGVCTNRGAIYAALTFLAEGDASHLVTREGYENSHDPRDAPKFLQGIKQVLEMPPRAIEQRFAVDSEEGVAYEMLLRNGTLRGKSVHLNMGGFLYTNRQSLSVGLVLPADNLHEQFDGDPNLLMEWFLHLPSLQPWLAGARQGPFGAKIIRGGGARDVPTLIDNGLAIGGAASAIGIDFPYPNFTGPATAMGLLIAHAARKIREDGGTFTRAELDRHYLQPLRKTHYWEDVEFLRLWPGYVKKTSFFFGRNIDVALGSAYLWTRPGSGRWRKWLHLVNDLTGGDHRQELGADFCHFQDALRIPEVAPRPSPWRLLLDGALNTCRDLLGQPRKLPAHGEIVLHYSIAGGAEPAGLPPAVLRHWFVRYAPAIAAAARIVYGNDTKPLKQKLPAATQLLTQQVSLTDFARALGFGLWAGAQWIGQRLSGKPQAQIAGEASEYFQVARTTTDLTPMAANATQAWEARLAQLSYATVKGSHIHLLWPQSLPDKNEVTKAGLWHVCPAHVYEARVSATGQLQVVVNFENCIKCETCWRTSDIVDWGRDGAQRFVYAVHSPAVEKLLADMDQPRSSEQRAVDSGKARDVESEISASEETRELVEKLEQKLREFDEALEEEPRTVDRDRAEHLQMLARYAHQLALEMCSSQPERGPGGHVEASGAPTRSRELCSESRLNEMVLQTQKRLDYVNQKRYAWTASQGRQLRYHHLPMLSQTFQTTNANHSPSHEVPRQSNDGQRPWVPELLEQIDAAFQPSIWRDLENKKPLTAEQNAVLLAIIGQVPSLNPPLLGNLVERNRILAHLAQRDPSLAYRTASHLWARDLTELAGGAIGTKAQEWPKVGQWACLAILDDRRTALFVPGSDAQIVVVLDGEWLRICTRGTAGLTSEPLATLGLRGAGLIRVKAGDNCACEMEQAVDAPTLLQFWERISAYDLVAMAQGMADYLCQRALDHAGNRVQFPGLFHDEESRDAIAKFGSVKKMMAEMTASRNLIRGCLPAEEVIQGDVLRIGVIKAIVAETLGTAPGSIVYNAGQIFGGTGYSEDDTLSKFYRDASAWRFLGLPNNEAFARQGAVLMKNWTVGGEQLSKWRFEEEAFQVIEQRQALAKELARIREQTGRLVHCVNEWHFAADALPATNAQAAIIESLGRQDGLLLVGKKLLLWTHEIFEDRGASEADVVLLRTWLKLAQVAFEDFTALLSTFRQSSASPVLADAPPVTQYAYFLKTDLPYSSGDFLSRPTDPLQPRYLPEMVETDEFLSKRNNELIECIIRQFGQPRNGMVYERYLEEQHRPDAADLDFLRQNGFFRMPIPRELGGEGRSKADYYLLTVDTHRLADAAISLTIQVNSSLGTTPVLLARDKDLPKALKDAAPGELRDELMRRREAADLFCRWVASGQISAFALTEPSAGSDTARVATRARLRQVPVEREANGVYRFVPAGGKGPRILLDARRLEFAAKPQAAYRWSDSAEPAPIHFDEYDYETDASKKRYFVDDSQRIYFDDIAQLREREGRLWYDYWELTGAKMWITNGRVMGIMVLYAKTDKGVTGFMVDRHAEGLIVGKDEAKMGQNGSPTNELALQAVRVPRENVVGLEGRGQVNALETLNVGRAGLAMSAMCQMVRLCEWSGAFARERYGEMPAWIGWRLDRMEEERFIAEAMSFEIIGRFEHKQTKSVRMESAIAKMLVSELFHHSIELAEEIHGLDGQTQKHLIEKRKRDARVLNIYEGTNEIQRFLILKELTEVAATWKTPHPQPLSPQAGRGGPDSRLSPQAGRGEPDSPLSPLAGRGGGGEGNGPREHAQAIDALKERLRQLTTEAVQFFGHQLWQNPNLQASCFVLSEATAWVAAAESALGRLTWLSRKGDAALELQAAGRRALARCRAEVERRLERFAEELVNLRRGHYAPEIRAASLLFQHKETPTAQPPKSIIGRPLSILVVVDPPTPGVPQPRTHDGRLMEPYRVLTEGDRAALETALRLRDAGEVRIEVVAVASGAARTVLREALSLGIDHVRLVVTDGAISPDRAAAALAQTLSNEPGFDLVLGGAGGRDAQEGLLARLTAEVLVIPFAGSASQLAVDTSAKALRLVDSDGHERTRPMPGSVMVEPSLTLRAFTIDGWLKGLEKGVETVPWPKNVAAAPREFEEMATATRTEPGEMPARSLLPREASRLLLDTAGIEAAAEPSHRLSTVHVPPPAIADTAVPFFAVKNGGPVIVAVVAADAEGKLKATARRTLDAAQFLKPFFQGARKAALVVVPRTDEAQERALAELTALTPFDVCLLALDAAETSEEVRCRLLTECWSGLENFPAAVVGEPWAEPALVALAAASGTVDPIALRVRLLDRHQGKLVAEGTCAKGKLRTRQTLEPAAGQPIWIALTAEAEVGAATPAESNPIRRVERWSPRLERFFGRHDIQRLLQELKQETGLVRLSDAEFIIDVGFGVGNRDGYEAVIEPLERELRRLGVRGLTIGGSRKVTEELHLLPADRQIGQSGVSVNPRVLLAIGVSGAPQHLNYIGPRATIIAFNRDPEAPLLTLNQRQANPKVYPVIGDLFETVPAFIAYLQEEATNTPAYLNASPGSVTPGSVTPASVEA